MYVLIVTDIFIRHKTFAVHQPTLTLKPIIGIIVSTHTQLRQQSTLQPPLPPEILDSHPISEQNHTYSRRSSQPTQWTSTYQQISSINLRSCSENPPDSHFLTRTTHPYRQSPPSKHQFPP